MKSLLATPTYADYTSGTGSGSDSSICPINFALYQNGAPYGGTWVKIDGTDNLEVNVNTKNLQTGYSIRASLPDGQIVDSNPAGSEF